MPKTITKVTVSVLIPTPIPEPKLERLLNSWPKFPSWLSFELITATCEGQFTEPFCKELTKDWLTWHTLSYAGPFNFSRAVNLGLRQAAGDYLLILNNDVVMRNGDWLLCALQHEKVGDADFVGAAEFVPRRNVFLSGFNFRTPRLLGANNRYLTQDQLHLQGCEAVEGVPFSALLARKQTLQAVGGLEERLPLGLNDVEFFMRVSMSARFKTIVCKTQSIEHDLSATRGEPRSIRNLGNLARDHLVFTFLRIFKRHVG